MFLRKTPHGFVSAFLADLKSEEMNRGGFYKPKQERVNKPDVYKMHEHFDRTNSPRTNRSNYESGCIVSLRF